MKSHYDENCQYTVQFSSFDKPDLVVIHWYVCLGFVCLIILLSVCVMPIKGTEQNRMRAVRTLINFILDCLLTAVVLQVFHQRFFPALPWAAREWTWNLPTRHVQHHKDSWLSVCPRITLCMQLGCLLYFQSSVETESRDPFWLYVPFLFQWAPGHSMSFCALCIFHIALLFWIELPWQISLWYNHSCNETQKWLSHDFAFLTCRKKTHHCTKPCEFSQAGKVVGTVSLKPELGAFCSLPVNHLRMALHGHS